MSFLKYNAHAAQFLRKINHVFALKCDQFACYKYFMRNKRKPLDIVDSKLLAELQVDAHLSAQELSERLNLSGSQIGRRRQRLEAEGYISGYSARLDPHRVGLSVQAFVQVQMSDHTPETSQSFMRLAEIRQEVISAWTLTGESDYLLRVFCEDLPALNTLIHKVLLPHDSVARVQSQIVMDQFKADAPLPT